MIENIKNIGQLLMPVNQVIPCKSDAPVSKRFSIDVEQSKEEKSTSEIPTADNKSEDVKNSGDKDNVQKSEYAVEKKCNNESAGKTGNHEDKNQKMKDSVQTEEGSDTELQDNEQVNIQSDVDVNDSPQKKLPEQNVNAKAANLYVLEQLNTVADHTVKPEQIKTLIETEKGMPELGIKTILPEQPIGENELKQVSAPVDGQKANTASSEINTTQNVSELLSNNNVEQISSDTFTDKNSQITVKDVFNMVQEQKDVMSEIISEGKSKIEELTGDIKSFQQISQVTNSHTQNLPDTGKQTEEHQTADNEINVSQAALESDDLSDGSAGNTNDSLKQKPDIADILPSNSENNNNARVFDDNKILVDETFSNSQTNDAQKYTSDISGKVSSDILKENSENDVSAQISKHITESIHGSTIPQGGEKQITVRLNPPELGSVTIKFSEKNSELTGTLQVSKAETKAEIQHAMPDIIRSLSESGIQLKKIDIVSSENKFNTNDSAKEQLLQGDNSDHSGQSDSGNHNAGTGDFNKSGFRQWLSSTIEYSRGYSLQNTFASGSINMLA